MGRVEEWRDAPGWECVFEVSNLGNVRSVDRRVKHGKGLPHLRLVRGRKLEVFAVGTAPHSDCWAVRLSTKKRRGGNFPVHELVLKAFVGGCPEHGQAVFKDGDRYNARLNNLKWEEPNSEEEWRDVLGWEGYYQVSDQGRVRSLDRVVQLSNRRCSLKGRLIRQKKTGPPGKDYWTVSFSRPGMRKKNFKVHHLVLWAFVAPKPSPKHQGCHGDGDRFNNQTKNLRWGTPTENAADMIKHGRTTRGEKSAQATLTATQVQAIRKDRRVQTEIAKDYSISQAHVCRIQRRKTWRHIA